MNCLAIITVQVIISDVIYDLGTLFYNPLVSNPYSYVNREGTAVVFTNYYSAYCYMMEDMKVGK